MAKSTLKNDYKNAALKKTKVYLIESGPRILSGFHENLSQKAQKDLEKLGVEVITNQMADDLSADGLKVGEKEIKCKTIIWAAGVEPVSLIKNLKASKNDRNQIIVGDDLSLNESNNIFAIGDIAYKEDSEGKPLPGVAPVALQQGDFVGKLIRNEVKKAKKREKFKYFDKGLMATIGRSKAVLESGSIRLTGLIAWLAWVFVHIVYLLRFRNKIFVLLQWSWSYFKFGNGARLIVSKNWKNSSNSEDK
jgi:NADH dehydrogenase